MTTSYQKISEFDRPHVSEMLSDSKISTLECGFKNFRIRLRIRRMRVDDIAVSGKKKLRIQKYPDTCGRGLRSVVLSVFIYYSILRSEIEKKGRRKPFTVARLVEHRGDMREVVSSTPAGHSGS